MQSWYFHLVSSEDYLANKLRHGSMYVLWANPGLFFFIFVFFITVGSKSFHFLMMTGFEPRTSAVGSDCSTI